MHGEGDYALTSVKEMVYTSEFILLDEKVRGCQNKETVQECETKKYLDNLIKTCNCTPYHLMNGNKNVSNKTVPNCGKRHRVGGPSTFILPGTKLPPAELRF